MYAIAARHALLRAYRAEQRHTLRQLADLVPAEPVPHLVAEAKVWSFWPARLAWVRELDERYPTGAFELVGRRIVRALVQWRDAHPALDDALVSAVTRIDTAVGIMLDQPGGPEQSPAMALLRAAARDLATLRRDGKAT